MISNRTPSRWSWSLPRALRDDSPRLPGGVWLGRHRKGRSPQAAEAIGPAHGRPRRAASRFPFWTRFRQPGVSAWAPSGAGAADFGAAGVCACGDGVGTAVAGRLATVPGFAPVDFASGPGDLAGSAAGFVVTFSFGGWTTVFPTDGLPGSFFGSGRTAAAAFARGVASTSPLTSTATLLPFGTVTSVSLPTGRWMRMVTVSSANTAMRPSTPSPATTAQPIPDQHAQVPPRLRRRSFVLRPGLL